MGSKHLGTRMLLHLKTILLAILHCGCKLLNMFHLVFLFMVFHYVGGAEFLDQAPVSDDRSPFYFMLFGKGTEETRTLEFSIQGSSSSYYLNALCRETNGKNTIDLITNGNTEENQVVLDTLFVTSCKDFEQIYYSIFPQAPSPDQETFIFVDAEGKCHKRNYTPKTWRFTATVKRHKVEEINCPQAILSLRQATNKHNGIILDWSPEGLGLQTFFLDKPANNFAPVVMSVKFPNAWDFKLVCRADKIRYSDPAYVYMNTLLTATVEYNGVPLDRFQLSDPSGEACHVDGCRACNVDNITPATTSGAEGEMHTIAFKTPQGFREREYQLSTETHLATEFKPEYKIITLVRRDKKRE